MHEMPDCRTCGLCCTPDMDYGYLPDIEEHELARFSPTWVRRCIVKVGKWKAIRTASKLQRCGPFAGTKQLVCIALRGSLMHRVSCAIYDRRPDVCRDAIKPGDADCLALHKMTSLALTGARPKKKRA